MAARARAQVEARAKERVEVKIKARVEEKGWARAGGLAAAAVRVGTRVADTAREETVSAPNAVRKCRTSRGRNAHH